MGISLSLYSCMEVCDPLELLFGMVSVVCPGIHILHGGPCGSREGADFGVDCPQWTSGFSGLIFKRNVFDSCVKS